MIDIDQDPDHVPERPLGLSGIVVIVGIILSILATIALIGQIADRLVIDTIRPARVEADPYELEAPAERLRADGERRLDSYGWVDRAGGTIHVPLDVAIEHYLEARR